MYFRRFGLTLLAAAICTTSAFAQPTTGSSTISRSFTFSPVGLASSETAQISVVNVAVATSGGTAASCTGTIAFLDANGAAIGAAAGFTVASGKIASASLPFTKANASGRAEIRGVVSLTESTTAQAPCSLLVTLETFDTITGVTHVYQGNGTVALPEPAPGMRHPM